LDKIGLWVPIFYTVETHHTAAATLICPAEIPAN